MKRQKTFFISSKWRNRDAVVNLTKKLRGLGFKVLSFLEYHPDKKDVSRDPGKVMKKFESRSQKNRKMARQLFRLDIKHIKKADTVILLLPAGTSTNREVGCAYGLGKECILVGKPDKTETTDCMFSKSFETADKLISYLKKKGK